VEIFQLKYTGAAKNFTLIYDVLPSYQVGFIFWILGIILFLWFLKFKIMYSEIFQNTSTLLISSLVLMGTYIYTATYINEVFVGLEQPYNLFHHGLFSFSPNRMVDGTSDLLYLLFFTPFAFNQEILLLVYYLVGGLVGWLHLFLLWKMLSNSNLSLKLLLLFIFSLSFPLISVFSTGFGNSFISLIVFWGIYYLLNGKTKNALVIASILPLIRPDAILYSFCIFFIVFIHKRKISTLHLTLSIFSLICYMSICKAMYGHWVPSCVSLKSPTISMIPLMSWYGKIGGLRSYMIEHIIFFTSLIISIPLRKIKPIRVLQDYFIPFFGVYIFYWLTKLEWYHGEYRYAVVFELFTVIFPILFIDIINREKLFIRIKSKNYSSWNIEFQSLFTKWSLFILVIIIYIIPFYKSATYPYSETSKYTPIYENGDGVAGQFIDQIIPEEWTLATTELNGIGYMSDREIIGLAGYTNPAIAKSNILSSLNVRINPNYFIELKPDVFHYRAMPVKWFSEKNKNWQSLVPETWFDANSDNYSSIPLIDKLYRNWETAISSDLLSKREYLLGDINKVINYYDGVIFRIDDWIFPWFVRKELTLELIKKFEENNYTVIKSRPLDQNRFKKYYDKQNYFTRNLK
jgi:hypothetical protein